MWNNEKRMKYNLDCFLNSKFAFTPPKTVMSKSRKDVKWFQASYGILDIKFR